MSKMRLTIELSRSTYRQIKELGLSELGVLEKLELRNAIVNGKKEVVKKKTEDKG